MAEILPGCMRIERDRERGSTVCQRSSGHFGFSAGHAMASCSTQAHTIEEGFSVVDELLSVNCGGLHTGHRGWVSTSGICFWFDLEYGITVYFELSY